MVSTPLLALRYDEYRTAVGGPPSARHRGPVWASAFMDWVESFWSDEAPPEPAARPAAVSAGGGGRPLARDRAGDPGLRAGPGGVLRGAARRDAAGAGAAGVVARGAAEASAPRATRFESGSEVTARYGRRETPPRSTSVRKATPAGRPPGGRDGTATEATAGRRIGAPRLLRWRPVVRRRRGLQAAVDQGGEEGGGQRAASQERGEENEGAGRHAELEVRKVGDVDRGARETDEGDRHSDDGEGKSSKRVVEVALVPPKRRG